MWLINRQTAWTAASIPLGTLEVAATLRFSFLSHLSGRTWQRYSVMYSLRRSAWCFHLFFSSADRLSPKTIVLIGNGNSLFKRTLTKSVNAFESFSSGAPAKMTRRRWPLSLLNRLWKSWDVTLRLVVRPEEAFIKCCHKIICKFTILCSWRMFLLEEFWTFWCCFELTWSPNTAKRIAGVEIANLLVIAAARCESSLFELAAVKLIALLVSTTKARIIAFNNVARYSAAIKVNPAEGALFSK